MGEDQTLSYCAAVHEGEVLLEPAAVEAGYGSIAPPTRRTPDWRGSASSRCCAGCVFLGTVPCAAFAGCSMGLCSCSSPPDGSNRRFEAIRGALRCATSILPTSPVPVWAVRLLTDLVLLPYPRLLRPPICGCPTPRTVRAERGCWTLPPGMGLPHGDAGERTVLFLHGGAFALCTPRTYIDWFARLALRTAARVFAVDYRRSPEAQHPAAIEECIAAYRWLLEQGAPPGNIVVMGDSAGGALVVATLAGIAEVGRPCPAGAAVAHRAPPSAGCLCRRAGRACPPGWSSPLIRTMRRRRRCASTT